MKPHLRIIYTRQQKGLTQEELAERAGISCRTIQRIESGETMPRSFTAKAIAEALGSTFEELFGEEQKPDVTIAGRNRHNADNVHFLKMLNLSCFFYLVIPWVHFLVPNHLLKKQSKLPDDVIIYGRKIVGQQIYWLIALHLLILLTLAYNITQVRYFHTREYIVSYFWPFIGMYLVNAGMILKNDWIIRKKFNRLISNDSRLNVV